MSDFDSLQARLADALDRISAGVGPLTGGADETELNFLKEALDEEKTVNAQLEERLKGLKDDHARELDRVQADGDMTRERVEQLDLELQRLRQANDALRRSNVALRDANAAGLADAGLINAGLQAEVESLGAARAADVAEMTALLDAMAPLVSGNGPEQADHQKEAASDA